MADIAIMDDDMEADELVVELVDQVIYKCGTGGQHCLKSGVAMFVASVKVSKVWGRKSGAEERYKIHRVNFVKKKSVRVKTYILQVWLEHSERLQQTP